MESANTYQTTEFEKELITKHFNNQKVIVDSNFKGNHILKES